VYAMEYLTSHAGNFYIIYLVKKKKLNRFIRPLFSVNLYNTRGAQNKVYFAKYAKRTVSVDYMRDLIKKEDNIDNKKYYLDLI
jgi:hypothetical protein